MHLVTPRLILREFVETDFAALRELTADPEVLRYRRRKVITEEMIHAFLAQAQQALRQEAPCTQYPYALVLRSDGRLIGECGLTLSASSSEQTAFLWYSLNRAYWGQGYMTEAAQAVVEFGFVEVGLAQIVAGCHPDNIASIRVLEKIGLRRDPVSEAGDKPGAALHFTLRREDWRLEHGKPEDALSG